MAISPEALWAHVDALQMRNAELEARVDALCAQMNTFVLEIREHICALLGAKITDDAPSGGITPKEKEHDATTDNPSH